MAKTLSEMRTFSTEEAAEQIGIHPVTLHKWLAAGVIRPTLAIPFGTHTVWRWTLSDLEEARKAKAQRRRGPKPRARG
jgi:predicted site-specific integrase-resolvase